MGRYPLVARYVPEWETSRLSLGFLSLGLRVLMIYIELLQEYLIVFSFFELADTLKHCCETHWHV